MGQPYIGEIRMFGFSFPPNGWADCDGQVMPISENDALFTLIGTTYGGDGQETFGLPNLQSRTPIHMGQGPGISNNYQLAEALGVEQVTVSTQQIPNHAHLAVGSTAGGGSSNPTGNIWSANSNTAAVQFTVPANINGTMNNQTIQPTGGSQPHDNMPPYLCIRFCISLFGIFPHQ